MIIAPDKTWCYLGPPKTGSTTLTELFQGPPFHGIYSGHQHDMQPPPGTGYVFATVRNPWTRVLSLWKHRQLELRQVCKSVPFGDFMYQLLDETLEEFFAWPMARWLRDVDCATVRLEYLAEDLRHVLPNYDWDKIIVPRLNTTDHVGYTGSPFAALANRDQVRRWAYEDFLRFGYSWEPPHDPPAVSFCSPVR